jgi:fructan beta-fructosidase
MTSDMTVDGNTMHPTFHERYRPQVHFTAAANWINDPNGLIYYKGEYHIFYQLNMNAREACWNTGDKPRWGHAVSTDLLRWQHLPVTSIQSGSGSAVLDAGNTAGFGKGTEDVWVAFYRGCLSFSTDCGLTWTPYGGNPVLPKAADPYVFRHEPSGQWIMVTFIHPEARRDFCIYRSDDLRNWTLASVRKGESHECPCLFELPVEGSDETRWILHGGNGEYRVGQFDGTDFTPESGRHRMDWGHFYASQIWTNTQQASGRTLQIAWMNGANFPPEMPFNQQLTFPCELTLRRLPEGLRVCRTPVREIETLHEATRHWSATVLVPGDNPLAGVEGDGFDLLIEARLAETSELWLTLQGLILRYIPAQQILCLGAHVDTHEPLAVTPLRLPDDRLRLRVLVDRASIEVFADQGQVALTQNCFPPADNRSLSLTACGGPVHLDRLIVHTLASAVNMNHAR